MEKTIKNFIKDRKGIFGLNAVQAFFVLILSIALLAFVIVVIMGTLSQSTIIPQTSGTATNETNTFINQTGDTLNNASLGGFGSPAITAVWAVQGGLYNISVPLANVTVSSAGVIRNATITSYSNASVSYTYSLNSNQGNNANSILGNVSNGVTGFFSAINPVYAILAVLVIILILVVLVRVVGAPEGRNARSPQL